VARRDAGLETVSEFLKGAGHEFASAKDKESSQRTGDIRAKSARKGSVAKGTRSEFLKYALSRQRTEGAIESIFVKRKVARKIRSIVEAALDGVGDAKFRDSAEGLVQRKVASVL